MFKLKSFIFDKALIVAADVYYHYFYLITQIAVYHRVSYVFSYCSTPPINTLECIGGCAGSVEMHANCTESNSIENWADFEGETIFDIRNSTSIRIDLRSVLWIYISCNSDFSISFKYGKMIICLIIIFKLTKTNLTMLN